MEWNKLEQTGQLAIIREESKQQPVLIFKHSTSCSISAAALARIERAWKAETPVKAYYLDLIAYRGISNEIASIYNVEHQSPQALLIKDERCVYHESHMSIDMDEMLKA